MSDFLTLYKNEISPKLRSLDLAIKCPEIPINNKELSNLLNISEKEIDYILKAKKLNKLSPYSIPVIMLNGSSYICRIFRKTINIGCPEIYTASDIAYIYNFNYMDVTKICHKINKYKFTSDELPLVFKYITYPLQP